MKAARHALILVGLFSLLWYSVAEGAEWVSYGESPTGNRLYYDKSGITPVSDNIANVWTKIIYSKKTAEDMIEQFKNDFAMVAYEITLHQINCSNREYRGIQITKYDSDGGVIETVKKEGKWTVISPETVGENLYKAVCPPRKTQ